ncbi:FHA domain-containing protein [Bifidobacterium reuteri]|uniref:FHA domain-containing protein n=1 Tax=Bifidobacterium reuteri TaxID=983706 RepID=UPI00168BE937|nr:FHA domain-containing protein [Bifidobacterium reuteri]
MSEWTVRINGVDQVSVKPGESLEIGRKPLRPLAADGHTRLDVVDQTKSMSKRHALFSVQENGSACVRDLGSTNGSYVVRDNGDLLRLPANADFLLPVSPMRMQFGDVPADFIRIDEPVDAESSQPVPDLFGYATSDAPQEPDAADMSVDDILDLRAGEPTAIFSADSVKRKVNELELGSLNIVQLNHQPEEPLSPRDLFADAEAQQQAAAQEPVEPETPAESEQPKSALRPGIRISGLVPVDAIAHPAHLSEQSSSDHTESVHAEPNDAEPVDQTTVVPDQSSGSTATQSAEQGSGPAQDATLSASASESDGDTAVPESTPADGESVERSEQSSTEQSSTAQAYTEQSNTEQSSAAQSSDEQTSDEQTSNPQADDGQTTNATETTDGATRAANPALVFEPIVMPGDDTAGDGAARADGSGTVSAAGQTGTDTAFAGAAAGASEYAAANTYTPAFEPGSVFDKVAKGELKAQEPVVEVDGYNSNDAKTTQDFSVQFEIARRPELLAFLAMNPYLYDDMYAWLAARGEADIDEALANNKGYQEYREAVGK